MLESPELAPAVAPSLRIPKLGDGAWLRVVILACLFVALFRFNLVRIWDRTNPLTGEANWGHVVFVPLISLFQIYRLRHEIARTLVRPAWSGLAVLLGGIFLFLGGIWPVQRQIVQDLGMLTS